MFSLALERGAGRNDGTGQLALGGLVTIDFDQTFTSTPLEVVAIDPSIAIEATNYSYYTIFPDGFHITSPEERYYPLNKHSRTSLPMIVDSGTTLVSVPDKLAKEVNELYDPPSVYIKEEGVYANRCDAIPPTFAVRINGTDFFVSSQDMLPKDYAGQVANTGLCVTGIQPSEKVNVLGEVFLNNVVAVFDIGANEMRFAPHENY